MSNLRINVQLDKDNYHTCTLAIDDSLDDTWTAISVKGKGTDATHDIHIMESEDDGVLSVECYPLIYTKGSDTATADTSINLITAILDCDDPNYTKNATGEYVRVQSEEEDVVYDWLEEGHNNFPVLRMWRAEGYDQEDKVATAHSQELALTIVTMLNNQAPHDSRLKYLIEMLIAQIREYSSNHFVIVGAEKSGGEQDFAMGLDEIEREVGLTKKQMFSVDYSKAYYANGSIEVEACDMEEAERMVDDMIGDLEGNMQYCPDDNTISVQDIYDK